MSLAARGVDVEHGPAIPGAAVVHFAATEETTEGLAAALAASWETRRTAGSAPLVYCGGGHGILGAPGRAHAAALDCFVAALARHRRPLVTGTLDWVRDLDGVVGLDAEAFVDALEPCLAGLAHVIAMRFDRRRWRESALSRAYAPLFSTLDADTDADQQVDTALTRSLAQADPRRRMELLRAYVIDELAAVTGNARAAIGLDDPLQQLGVDSLMAVALRNRIEARLGVTASTTLIWTHPSARALAAHLAQGMGRRVATADEGPTDEGPTDEAPAPTAAAPSASIDKLARLLAAAQAAATESPANPAQPQDDP